MVNVSEANDQPPKPHALRSLWATTIFGAVMLVLGYYFSLLSARSFNLDLYGLGLMIFVPLLTGVIQARIFHDPKPRGAVAALLLGSNVLALLALYVIAAEGVICGLMALPINLAGQGIGLSLGIRTRSLSNKVQMSAGLLAIPVVVAANAINPIQEREVVTVVEVDASPEEVWRYVVGFPQIPADAEKPITFYLRYPKPQRCETEGTGVGSMRYCLFDQGVFAEQVTVWEPGRELSFEVVSQVERINPYMSCTRGQFLLEALPSGGTRITGTTWYGIFIQPAPYYGLWADKMIHDIHLAVLWHIRDLAEGKRQPADHWQKGGE